MDVTAFIGTTIGALFLGAAVGSVTLVGLINNQTSPSGPSPVSVKSDPTVEYGSTQ